MEPDILATPGDAVVGRVPSAAVDGTHSPPASPVHDVQDLRGVAHGFAGDPVRATAPIGFTAPVAVNGHGAAGVTYREGSTLRAINGNGWHGPTSHAVALSPALADALDAIDARGREGLYLRGGKRVLDVVGAIVALVATAPIMLLAALAIKLESRGPILYRSVRIGRNGRPFVFLKLRSMVEDADRHRHTLSHLNECDGPVFKISRDPRVTRIGRFLRTTSIDEVPQFLNVLRGEMSLVGPRPPIPEEVAQYEPWQLRRLDVSPGITCLWQISGRSRIGFQEWMRLDLEYIKHRSFGLDLKILLRTIPAVLSREGAY
jgi:lipopolysaccharide/colanic/teichoic acid biosynthesis glycosyltransferase